MIQCSFCLHTYSSQNIDKCINGYSICKVCRSGGYDIITLGSSGADKIQIGGAICETCSKLESECDCKKRNVMEKDDYVNMMYHLKDKLQKIMDMFDDGLDIQAHYQLGGMRSELEYFIKKFEDEDESASDVCY